MTVRQVLEKPAVVSSVVSMGVVDAPVVLRSTSRPPPVVELPNLRTGYGRILLGGTIVEGGPLAGGGRLDPAGVRAPIASGGRTPPVLWGRGTAVALAQYAVGMRPFEATLPLENSTLPLIRYGRRTPVRSPTCACAWAAAGWKVDGGCAAGAGACCCCAA
eukprot:1195296-Prorocentrum_minimum.AAC.4